MAILTVGIAGVNGVLRTRGLTSVGPQRHKIPAEIQPRIRSDECAVHRATCDSPKKDKIHLWIASASQARHQGLTTSTLNSIIARMNQSKTLVTKHETTGKTRRAMGDYSTQCMTNSHFVRTSRNAARQLSDSWDSRARWRLVVPSHKRVRCEASGRVLQNFGHVKCHKMIPGNPTDITATYSRSFAIIWLELQLPCLLHLWTLLPKLNMSGEFHMCPLCHTPGMPRRKGDAWFWGCQNNPTCTAPTTATPSVPQNLKKPLLKQQTKAVNERIPAKGCRHLLVKPWADGTGKGNACQLCGAIITDKGEITGTSKAIQRRLTTAEMTPHSNPTVEGRTELDPVQDEIDKAKRLLEEHHLEVQAAQSRVTEEACRVEEAMEEMAKIKSLIEAHLESADRWNQVTRNARWVVKKKTCWKMLWDHRRRRVTPE